jgi:hypothetical protein
MRRASSNLKMQSGYCLGADWSVPVAGFVFLWL